VDEAGDGGVAFVGSGRTPGEDVDRDGAAVMQSGGKGLAEGAVADDQQAQ